MKKKIESEKKLTYREKEIVDATHYSPEEIEKLADINHKLGKWKRKTLSEKERRAIKTGKENPTED